MKKTKIELERKILCTCMELPCVHNPEISEDVKIEIILTGEKTKKGVKYLYLPKKRYQIIEETDDTMKLQILE